MSDSFDERRKNFEEKWAHDEDLRFKVVVRRNKLLGQWAARELGLNAPEIDAYARAVVQVDLKEPGEEDVLRKIRADFDAKKIAHSDQVIRRKMDELLTTASEQVMQESAKP
jgi:hypothetical protein